jgi:1-acyl-sn-glycerol-3-phosphate acyltransferase
VGGALFIFCLLLVFLRCEVLLHWYAQFRPSALQRFISDLHPTTGRKLFFLARMFAGVRADFERFRGALPPVFLIVSNHQTLADIPALTVVFHRRALRFVAKKSLGRGIPYVSTSLRWGRHALISRTGDYREGQQELRSFADLSKEGICPVVFPEGTRSRSGKVGEFFTGAVRIILERAPMPVMSVAIDGGHRIATLARLLGKLRGTYYRIRPLTLYPAPHGKREIIELLEKVRNDIVGQVREWRERDLPRGPRLQGSFRA